MTAYLDKVHFNVYTTSNHMFGGLSFKKGIYDSSLTCQAQVHEIKICNSESSSEEDLGMGK